MYSFLDVAVGGVFADIGIAMCLFEQGKVTRQLQHMSEYVHYFQSRSYPPKGVKEGTRPSLWLLTAFEALLPLAIALEEASDGAIALVMQD